LATERGAFVEYMAREAALWELLAFVKVRAVGGDAAVAAETEAAVREAIHRRATEAGPEALAMETRRVRSELEKRKGRAGLDIKYGEGGLLDIYFAIRYLQLRDDIRDGGEGRSTEQTLERLREAGSLSEGEYAAFSEGYRLLAGVDHALRLTIGRTTRLPLARPDTIALVAARTGHGGSSSLLAELTDRRVAVRDAFESVVVVAEEV